MPHLRSRRDAKNEIEVALDISRSGTGPNNTAVMENAHYSAGGIEHVAHESVLPKLPRAEDIQVGSTPRGKELATPAHARGDAIDPPGSHPVRSDLHSIDRMRTPYTGLRARPKSTPRPNSSRKPIRTQPDAPDRSSNTPPPAGLPGELVPGEFVLVRTQDSGAGWCAGGLGDAGLSPAFSRLRSARS